MKNKIRIMAVMACLLGILSIAAITQINLTSQVKGILPVANGGSGSNSPSLVAGSNVTISGSWPNQTVAAGTISGTSGGGLVLLEQHTASSSSELDFTSWYSSTYDEYLIEVVRLVPATNAVTIRLRFSTNSGSSYDSSTIYSDNCIVTAFAGSNRGAHNATATSHPLNLYDNDAPLSNDSTQGGLYATIRLMAAAGSGYKHMFGQADYWASSSTLIDGIGGLIYGSTSAVNAFNVFASSGNLASGTVRVYGVAKS